MRILFWRRRHYDLAERAQKSSERDRAEVEKVATDLRNRRAQNEFAPLLLEAFREGGS